VSEVVGFVTSLDRDHYTRIATLRRWNILQRLLAEMNAMEERMDANRERMEVKIAAEIKPIHDKMDA
jgi:hypothetical protein